MAIAEHLSNQMKKNDGTEVQKEAVYKSTVTSYPDRRGLQAPGLCDDLASEMGQRR